MTDDPELLLNVSNDELEALADVRLALSAQARLDELLRLNTDGQLATHEQTELDRFLKRADQLTILKTRARYTLQQRAGATRA